MTQNPFSCQKPGCKSGPMKGSEIIQRLFLKILIYIKIMRNAFYRYNFKNYFQRGRREKPEIRLKSENLHPCRKLKIYEYLFLFLIDYFLLVVLHYRNRVDISKEKTLGLSQKHASSRTHYEDC